MVERSPVNSSAEGGQSLLNEPAVDDSAKEIRSRLIKRLSVAGVMVALLLLILAFFDFLATPPDEPEVNVFTKPVPVGQRKEISQPVIASSNLPDPPSKPLGTEVAVPPAPELPPPAATTSEADKSEGASETGKAVEQSSPAEKAPEKSSALAPKPVPRSTASRSAGSEAPRVIVAPPGKRLAMPPPPAAVAVGEETMPVPISREAPASTASAATQPNARVVQVQPATVRPSAVARLFSGFVVQAGVFNDVDRAEELHARLALSGVPSSVEARVQVGPFKTRAEAEAAQVKLRALGIDSLLIPPAGARH